MEEIALLKSKIATLEGTMDTMREDAFLKEVHLSKMGKRYREMLEYSRYLAKLLEDNNIPFDKLPYL